MERWSVYEVLDNELEDDEGNKSRLQYQSGPFADKVAASKVASKLNHLYQGYYSFKVVAESKEGK